MSQPDTPTMQGFSHADMRSALAACAGPLSAQGADAYRRVYRLPASSLAFAGHFPGKPVLPAVVQTLMAQMTVEDALGRPLMLAAVVQAKFTAVLTPDEDITLSVSPLCGKGRKEGRKEGHWECALHAGDVQAASLRLHLEEATA